jgi:hypothetical protein
MKVFFQPSKKVNINGLIPDGFLAISYENLAWFVGLILDDQYVLLVEVSVTLISIVDDIYEFLRSKFILHFEYL